MKKWLTIFAYPMDNSVRAELLDSKEDVAVAILKYKDIRYLVAAFPVDEAMIYENQVAE